MDSLAHYVRTLQDANVPLIQLQDPSTVRGPALLVVTDEQRASLWAAANREHDRLMRGAWFESWWAKVGVAAVLFSSIAGGLASMVSLVHHG